MNTIAQMHKLLKKYGWKGKHLVFEGRKLDEQMWRRRGQLVEFFTYPAGPGWAMRCSAGNPKKLRPTPGGWPVERHFKNPTILEQYLKQPEKLWKELEAKQRKK